MERKKVIDYISVNDLEYDPENPRLPGSIDGDDHEGVINWMLTDASIIELMGSIGEKGFFPAEPLLVVPDKRKDRPGKYIVVEGNRRLTAVKLLNNPAIAKKRALAIKQIVKEAKIKPKELPVIKFDKREEILDYLGFKHITGVKPWSALAKAKYLKSLQKYYKHLSIIEQYKSLAKAIGSRSDYVKDLLTTLPVYETIEKNDFYDIDNLNEDTIDFGVYYNALKYQNIAEYVGVDVEAKDPIKKVNKENLEKLTRWVSEKDNTRTTRLGESRNLSKLNDVLGSKEALAQFEKGRTLDEASKYTEDIHGTFQKLLVEANERLRDALGHAPHIKISSSDMQLISEVISNAGAINTLGLSRKVEK